MSAVRTETVFFVRDVLARRVEQRWRDCGIARIELCERVNCSRWTLAAMMHREVGVGIERVAAFANVFECSPALLLDESEAGAPPYTHTLRRAALACEERRATARCVWLPERRRARTRGRDRQDPTLRDPRRTLRHQHRHRRTARGRLRCARVRAARRELICAIRFSGILTTSVPLMIQVQQLRTRTMEVHRWAW